MKPSSGWARCVRESEDVREEKGGEGCDVKHNSAGRLVGSK